MVIHRVQSKTARGHKNVLFEQLSKTILLIPLDGERLHFLKNYCTQHLELTFIILNVETLFVI